MPKRSPPLAPRAKQLVNLVVNAVALGTHDDDGELGVIAKQMSTTPARLEAIARKLEEQGYLKLKSTFLYPTIAALRAQQPSITDREAKAVLRRLK